ncbi:MAG: hypothetical protein U0R52_11235 [Solirubrobacterales bacterium]
MKSRIRSRAIAVSVLVAAVSAILCSGAAAAPVRYVAASDDSSHVLFETEDSLSPADVDDSSDLYMRAGGRTVLLAAGPGDPAGARDAQIENRMISADGSLIFFETSEALIAADTDSSPDTYRYTPGGPVLFGDGKWGPIVRISRDASRIYLTTDRVLDPADDDGLYDPYVVSGGVPTLLTPGTASQTNFWAVSDDGSHLYLSTNDRLTPDADPAGGMYVRSAGAYRAVAPGPCPPFTGCSNDFGGISADGTRAFLTTNRRLDPADSDIYDDVYMDAGGTPVLIGHPRGSQIGFNRFLANSADGHSVLLSSAAPLLPADTDTSTDIYRWTDGSLALVSGGRTPTADNSSGAEYVGASRDLSRVIFLTDAGLVPSDTGEDEDLYERIGARLRIISNLPEHRRYTYATNARISAGGSLVFFETSAPLVRADRDGRDQDVYGYVNSTRTLYLLTRDAAFRTLSQPASLLTASEDGSTVIFQTAQRMVRADHDASNDIYRRRGKTITLLSEGEGVPPSRAKFGALGTAPGANGLIAFTRSRYCDPDTGYCSPQIAGLYTTTPNGAKPRRLLDDATAGHPSFSRNGKLIAFQSSRDGNPEIYLVRPDGTGVTRLTDDPADDTAPQWLSDGRVLFSSDRDGDPDLYAVNPDGSGLVRIGETVGAASTDGRRIAVTACPRRNACDIYLYRPNGSRVARLTRAPGDDYAPQFSPDGRRIAFVSKRNGGPDGRGGSSEVYVMRADGSNQRRLTRPVRNQSHSSPVFSPDSQSVLFETAGRYTGGPDYTALSVLRLRTGRSRPVPIVGAGGIDFAADWQSVPKGRRSR